MLLQQITDTDNFIHRCVELSENVDNYISNDLFLADVEDPALVNPQFLKTQCLDIILEELRDRGIIFPNNAAEFQELLYDREIPLQLYQRFTEEYMFKLVKDLQDESRQRLMDEFDYDDDQLGARLCNVMSSILPMDAAWEYIASHEFMFFTNKVFRDKFQAVIEKALYEPPAAVPFESDLDRVAKWLSGEKKHQDELKALLMRVAERVYLNAGDNGSSIPLKNELLKKMERYDWDHRQPQFITKLTLNPNAEAEDELNHQQKNDHHVQYYLQHSGITDPQKYMVACTYVSKNKIAELEKELQELEVQITPEDKAQILNIAKIAAEQWVEMNKPNQEG